MADAANTVVRQVFEGSNVVVNMSVWESMESLAGFTYQKPEHLAIMRRRRQ